MPTISIDYGFFGNKDNPNKDNPVLVIKDRRSKALWAHLVPSKGIENPHGYQCLVRALNSTGYKRVILKSDQEFPIRSVAEKAAEKWYGEIIPEKAPKGESKSNGEIERAVQDAQGIANTIEEDVEALARFRFSEKIPF